MDFLFPEISTLKKVQQWELTALYDMIIGIDLLLAELTMDLRFSNQIILQDDLTVSMCTIKDQDNMVDVLATDAPILKLTKERQCRILNANYEVIDLDEKVNVMDSLSDHQKQQLLKTLKNFPTLFSEELGIIDIKPIHLEIKEDTNPKHSKAYPIPKEFEKITKKEYLRFCGIGVLEETKHSQ